MDALVEAARKRVDEALTQLDKTTLNPATHKGWIVRAIHAVDALKSALKTIQ